MLSLRLGHSLASTTMRTIHRKSALIEPLCFNPLQRFNKPIPEKKVGALSRNLRRRPMDLHFSIFGSITL
jgi:hypothetical protein